MVCCMLEETPELSTPSPAILSGTHGPTRHNSTFETGCKTWALVGFVKSFKFSAILLPWPVTPLCDV